MQVSDRQLLKQLRKSTGQLLKQTSNPEHQALLGAMDIVVNELLSRNAQDFYLDFYAQGHALLKEALAEVPVAASARLTFDTLPATLAGDLSADAIGVRAAQLCELLDQVVSAIGPTRDPQHLELLKRITAWELSLFAHRLERQPGDPTQAEQPSVTIEREALEAYLRRKNPACKDLEITHFHRVAGGFSKATILFDTVDAANGKQSLCIRAEQPIHLLELEGSNVENEFHLVQKAYESGIPVAEPLWVEADTAQLGTRFIISRKAAGANFGTAKGAAGQLSKQTVEDLARVMARIHNIPLNRDEAWIKQSHFDRWLDFGTIRQNTLARIEEWRAQSKAANLFPSPIITRARNWLTANVPACDEAPVFLHGDFGPHNILLDDGKVSAALDWEISTPGDPAYDVAWFLNCTSGAVDREQFLDAYRAAGGKPLSEYRLRYFAVFVCMMLPVTCNAALQLVQDNDAANINFALYGLQFMHEYPSRLDAAIAAAEASAARDGAW